MTKNLKPALSPFKNHVRSFAVAVVFDFLTSLPVKVKVASPDSDSESEPLKLSATTDKDEDSPTIPIIVDEDNADVDPSKFKIKLKDENGDELDASNVDVELDPEDKTKAKINLPKDLPVGDYKVELAYDDDDILSVPIKITEPFSTHLNPGSFSHFFLEVSAAVDATDDEPVAVVADVPQDVDVNLSTSGEGEIDPEKFDAKLAKDDGEIDKIPVELDSTEEPTKVAVKLPGLPKGEHNVKLSYDDDEIASIPVIAKEPFSKLCLYFALLPKIEVNVAVDDNDDNKKVVLENTPEDIDIKITTSGDGEIEPEKFSAKLDDKPLDVEFTSPDKLEVKVPALPKGDHEIEVSYDDDKIASIPLAVKEPFSMLKQSLLLHTI